MGHRYLQGYVFSRPLEADQLTDGGWERSAELPERVAATDAGTSARSGATPS
jgi:EAL domain-containing protein (putative c-di-GMP-specific phosphodiesterase class I)